MVEMSVASLNTRGIPLRRAQLAERYAAIAAAFEASTVDVVCFQELLTYWHLRRLATRMPSFRHVSFRPSVAGPAGGLATLSRLPVARTRYHRFPLPRRTADLPLRALFHATLKGALVTELAGPHARLVNTHPVANFDGDWSESNRHTPLQRSELTHLAEVARDAQAPTVVCGDFNVAGDSVLHRDFVAKSGLTDAFDGRCPPTFRAEYLHKGQTPYCIDFIMVSDAITVRATEVLFTGTEPLPGGPVALSDHLGLRATLSLP